MPTDSILDQVIATCDDPVILRNLLRDTRKELRNITREFKKAIDERDELRNCTGDLIQEWDEAERREKELKAKYDHLSEQYAKAITDLSKAQAQRNELRQVVTSIRDYVRGDRRESSMAGLLEDVCQDLNRILANTEEKHD